MIPATRTVWVETDLEPDDVLALYMLPRIDYCVVGEGDVSIKFDRINAYLRLLNQSSCKTIMGDSSIELTPFIKDVKEFETLDHCDSVTDYFQSFEEFARSETPVFFSLKPMRELLRHYKDQPEKVKALCSNVILYAYGGFNFRCVLKNDKVSLLKLLGCFKETHIYESFYVSGESNTVNKNTFPKLYDHITSNPKYATLLKLVKNWNQHIMSQCLNDNRPRSKKIVESIKEHEHFQFVLADFGLIAVHDQVVGQPIMNLRFVNNYTTFDITKDGSSCYVYHQMDNQLIENLILSKLNA
ncbi:Hypothetical protein POVR1_LOCUS473 [uncultured virus]|nr:Hypothetical protein POVR1_LOCUS473 [uncultured virus]